MIQKFNNLRKLVFGSTPTTADNAVARVADVNNLIDAITADAPYVSRFISLTQAGPGVAPVIVQPLNFLAKEGTVVSQPECKCKCKFPPSPNHNLDQYNGQCKLFCCIPDSYIAPGQIGLTIPLAAPFQIGIFVQNLVNYGEVVTVERLANDVNDAKFLIKVYNSAGLPSDNTLNNTMFNIVMFTGETV